MKNVAVFGDSAALLDRAALDVEETLKRVGLQSSAVPERFALKSAFGKSALSIRPRAFREGLENRIAFARVVRVDGGAGVQVLNIVIVPRIGSGLPVFGAEILQFKKGVHLVVLDLFPLHQSRREAVLTKRLEAIGEALRKEFSASETPPWGAQVFSKEVVLLKPGAKRAVGTAPFLGPLKELLDAYLERARSEEKEPGATHQEILAKRRDYLRDHADHEPAGPFLTRVSSPEWVESFVRDFLFPRWLHDGDRLPSWEEEIDGSPAAEVLLSSSLQVGVPK